MNAVTTSQTYISIHSRHLRLARHPHGKCACPGIAARHLRFFRREKTQVPLFNELVMKRILLITLLAIGLLLGSAWLAMRSYLHSSRVSDQVITKLEALYGGPVRMEKVDIGLTGTTVND